MNGSHSSLHREAFEPLLDKLDREEIARLSLKHKIIPRWPEPWVKSRTAGSDDHGLLNIGRTWTEFPPDVQTVEQALDIVHRWIDHPAAVLVQPTAQHEAVLGRLLVGLGRGGPIVSDAHLAALAIEHRATLLSFDRDFEQFAGLRVQRLATP